MNKVPPSFLPPRPASLSTPEDRKKIFIRVLVTHLLVLLVPFAVLLIAEHFRPERPKTMKVRLAPETKGPPKRAPGRSGPVILPPKISVPTPVREPHVTPMPPKPAAEPRLIVPKRTARRATPKRKNNDTKKTTPVKKTLPKDDIVPWTPPAWTPPAGAGGTDTATSGETDEYQSKLLKALWTMWETPHLPESNRGAAVLVFLSMGPDGTVLSASIRRGSGIWILDESVKKLLTSLKRLPAPPDGKAFSFEVEFSPDDAQ